MKKTFLFGWLVCLLGLTACKNTEPQPPVENEATFSVQATILGMESTPQLDENGAGEFASGDQNSLFFQDAQNAFLQDFTYTYGQNYFWSDIEGLDLKATKKLSACYPVVSTSTPSQFEWNITSSVANPDFLLAAPVAVDPTSSTPIAMTFKHGLHKLQVKLIAAETAITAQDLATATIQVQSVQPIAVLDLLKGKATGVKGEGVSLSDQGKHTSFLIPSQSTASIAVAVTVGKKTQTIPLANCQVQGQALTQLESGKTFVLTLSISAEKIMVLDQQIAPWEDQGGVQEDIII